MTDTSGVTAWQYDVQGRALAETKTIAGVGTFATAWEYDAAGRVVTATYPTGEAVRTTYNRRGLPETVAGLDDYLTGAAYNAAGQPWQQTWGNTRQTHYTYEPDTLRLQHLQVSGSLLDLAYTYDKVGNIRTLTDASNTGQVQTFTYDARDRLLTAQTNAVGQGQYHETYGYDLMGNIITRTVGGEAIDYTYGRRHGLTLTEPTTPATNTYQIYLPLVARNFDANLVQQPFAVVATSAGFRAGYDQNGNMLVRVEVSGTETITYTQEWDVENRLSVVTNTVTSDVTRFVYDGDGNRVWREQPDGSVTAYLGAVEVTISGTERLTTSYYFASGQQVAMREGGTVTYLHGDHLGSASLATDASGAQVSTLRYTPFGEIRYGDAPTDFRFTGQREESFGWYDYGARFYSPGLGRFVSADTIIPDPKNPQALNRHAYTINNPLKFIDPTGYDPLGPEWEEEFFAVHGTQPEDIDRLYRLYSLIFPGGGPNGSWLLEDWLKLNNELIYDNQQPDRRGVEDFAKHVEILASYYESNEMEQFIRAFSLLWGGVPYDMDFVEAIWTVRNGPFYIQLGYGNEGFAEDLIDLDHSIVHHYAPYVMLGYYCGSGFAASVNTYREIANPNYGEVNQADILLGNWGAIHGDILFRKNISIVERNLGLAHPSYLAYLIRQNLKQ